MSKSRVAAIIMLACTSAGWAGQPFTVVALPDPQNYTNDPDDTEKYFKGQTRWIVNNTASKNIVFTMGLGDMQNPGNPYYARTDNPYEPDLSRPTNNPVDERFWRRADSAIDILDQANIAYSLAPGNHDYLNADDTIEPIYWLKWFGPSRFANKPSFGGSSPETSSTLAGMNTYHFFNGGGRRYMNIVLEFGPGTDDLRWAQRIINENPGVPTIVTTHAMLDTNGYQNARRNIWDDFVKNNPQVIMTLNGHITGEYRQSPLNVADQPVHQMLVDYQATPFPGEFRGGGYMRLMEFDPDNDVVRVKSFSPIVNNGAGGFLTDNNSQFNLTIDFDGRFGPEPAKLAHRQTVSFRDGVDGYAGTRDTQIDGGQATTDLGAQAFVWVDADAPGATVRQGLLRFVNLFQAGRIEDGAVIESAILRLTTDTATDSQSTSSMSIYRLLVSWGEADTWNDLGGALANDGTEAILAANGTVTPTEAGGVVEFDVTESLYAWQQGAPNYGWVVRTTGGNGWRFVSSEGLLDARPALEVTYALVPEPMGSAVLVATGLAGLGRRRRR